MKKIDYLLMVVIVIFIIVLFIFIYIPYMNNISNNNIQIIINNQIVDEFNINDEYQYLIETKDNNIYIYRNSKLIKKINSNNKTIYNKIQVSNNEVKIIEANCSGKDCMHMKLNAYYKLPIICTNGIIIKYSNNNYNSDIIT